MNTIRTSFLFVLFAFLLIVGCEQINQTTKSKISIEDVSEYAPEFKRIYSKNLDQRCTIQVTIYMFGGYSLTKIGELSQPNGRWILFDPDRIADKIIDPVLVPLVQEAVDEINVIDKAFRKSKPDKFTDRYGNKWKRQ